MVQNIYLMTGAAFCGLVVLELSDNKAATVWTAFAVAFVLAFIRQVIAESMAQKRED